MTWKAQVRASRLCRSPYSPATPYASRFGPFCPLHLISLLDTVSISVYFLKLGITPCWPLSPSQSTLFSSFPVVPALDTRRLLYSFLIFSFFCRAGHGYWEVLGGFLRLDIHIVVPNSGLCIVHLIDVDGSYHRPVPLSSLSWLHQSMSGLGSFLQLF